ncbi:putative molybdenum carrier protein [Desulfogranum japonicum]|uniref:putative molybdenum carrier protein n=1 Tax=Desulfogranum japonicum TaxID=231447 RepID=UPI00040B0E46|nr:putative molybdenum carrier protein [Desulfogranum japonicum]
MKIISGGQTGADQAALDAAIKCGVEHGGWLPKGRKTEKGPLPGRYRLQEMSSGNYRDRTEKNILESDGTLICSHGKLSRGSALTEALAIRHNRPCLHINFNHYSEARAVDAIMAWILENTITTINVAGPRASGDPLIYEAVFNLISAVLRHLIHPGNRE